jgi:hypothetical protein
VLVCELNTNARKAYVHEGLYNSWLNEGGSPEALLGMLVSGRPHYSLSAISENKDALCRAWEQYVSLSQASLCEEQRRRFTVYAEAEVLAGLSELSELEQEFLIEAPNHRDLVQKRVRAQIEHLAHRIMDDPLHTALHLVAKGRFGFTAAYDILQKMEQAAKENPEIDPREAALLAAVDYIGRYLAGMVYQTK